MSRPGVARRVGAGHDAVVMLMELIAERRIAEEVGEVVVQVQLAS